MALAVPATGAGTDRGEAPYSRTRAKRPLGRDRLHGRVEVGGTLVRDWKRACGVGKP